MNVERILHLADVIEEHPEWFEMSLFGTTKGGRPIDSLYDTRRFVSALNQCGTTGCIAGLACWLWQKEAIAACEQDVELAARLILGLGDTAPFYYCSWPRNYYARFTEAATQAEKAAVAVAYLRHLARSA